MIIKVCVTGLLNTQCTEYLGNDGFWILNISLNGWNLILNISLNVWILILNVFIIGGFWMSNIKEGKYFSQKWIWTVNISLKDEFEQWIFLSKMNLSSEYFSQRCWALNNSSL